MRHLMTVGTAVVVLFLGSAGARDQEAGGWVGRRVITKAGTVLKIGRNVVEDGQREAGATGRQRPFVRAYRVERASGPWLWLVAEDGSASGWVRVAQVVPYDRAIDEFTRAARANPKDAWAFVARGILWFEKSEYDKAIADYNEAIRLDPKCAAAYNRRGQAWIAKRECDNAVADYNEANRLDPGYAAADNNRGIVGDKKSEYDKVMADVAEAARLDPTTAVIDSDAAPGRSLEGREAFRVDPASATAFKKRGDDWSAKLAYDRAIVDYTEAIRLDPKYAEAYSDRGWAWLAKCECDKAFADCNEAIRLDPKRAQAYNTRGEVWYARGAYDKALADFDEAIRLDPHNNGARCNREFVWTEKGKQDKDIADRNEAIRLDPRSAEAYKNRGNVWYEKGAHDKALVDYNEAIRLDPQLADAYNTRGMVWLADGEFEKALADFNEVTRIDPKYARAYHNRGCVWMVQTEYSRALADFEAAIRLDPKYAATYNNRGIIWLEKHEYDKAIADFSEATRLDPEKASVHYHRSGAWYQKGEYQKAIADCNEAIRLDPKYSTAYEFRAWIWATCCDERVRDGHRAVESATRACELTDGSIVDSLDTLAAACAEAGDFDTAVKWQMQYLDSLKEGQDKMLATARLSAYRAKEPYHVLPAALATDKVVTGADISVQQVEAELEGLSKVDQALSRSTIHVQALPAPPNVQSRIVAHVGAAVITLDELKEAVKAQVAKLPVGRQPSREEMKTLTGQVLDMLIERSTIVQAAQRELKTPAAIKLIMEIADAAWLDEELPPLLKEMEVANQSALQAKLAKAGRSLAAIRETYRQEFVARGYLEQKLKAKITPTDSELLDYYNAHREDFRQGADPAPFAEVQDDIRSIVRREKVDRESSALLETLRRQVAVTTIYDKKVEAAP